MKYGHAYQFWDDKQELPYPWWQGVHQENKSWSDHMEYDDLCLYSKGAITCTFNNAHR